MFKSILISVSIIFLIGCSSPDIMQSEPQDNQVVVPDSGSFNCVASGVDCKVPIFWEIRDSVAILTVKKFKGAMLSDRVYISLPEQIKPIVGASIAAPNTMLYNNNNRCFDANFYIDGLGILNISFRDVFKKGTIELQMDATVCYKL